MKRQVREILAMAILLLFLMPVNTAASEGKRRLEDDSLHVKYLDEDDAEIIEEDSSDIFESLPRNFYFSSGAGAWATEFELEADGTFTGVYHDSDMGDFDEGYPNGTVYICNFTGKFTDPQPLDDYIYSMELEYLDTEEMEGDVYYEDGIRYVCSSPYGFDDAGEFLIYMPDTPISEVEEGFMRWSFLYQKDLAALPSYYYGIYNVNGEQGFVGIADDAVWEDGEVIFEDLTDEEAIHCYDYFQEDCTWDEAFLRCKEMGGYLARINSQEEYEYILDHIPEEMEKVLFYLGARREEDEYEYYWVDEYNLPIGEIINSPDYWCSEEWLTNEPSFWDESGKNPVEENVLNIFYYDDQWVWNDVPNDIIGNFAWYRSKTGYICEYED